MWNILMLNLVAYIVDDIPNIILFTQNTRTKHTNISETE